MQSNIDLSLILFTTIVVSMIVSVWILCINFPLNISPSLGHMYELKPPDSAKHLSFVLRLRSSVLTLSLSPYNHTLERNSLLRLPLHSYLSNSNQIYACICDQTTTNTNSIIIESKLKIFFGIKQSSNIWSNESFFFSNS